MHPRSLLLATATAAALSAALPLTAHAASAELIDRATFDSTVDQTASSLHVAGATRGELGGYLDVLVTADDGTLPTGSSVCEAATVSAVLTVSPGETLSATVPGELCTSFSGDARSISAAVRSRDLVYAGTAHKRARLVGEGLVSVGVIDWLGGNAAFSATVRW